MEIKRYDMEYHYYAGVMESAEMEERSQGRYVLYEDVAPLLAELDETPVDKAWLENMFSSMLVGSYPNYKTVWAIAPGVDVEESCIQLECAIIAHENDTEIVLKTVGHEIAKPTRRQVLTALRLFGGQGDGT